MAITNLTEALAYLNESYEALGFAEAGSNTITAANMETTIQALPAEATGKILNQLYIILEQRFFRALFDREANEFKPFIRDIGQSGYGILDMFQELLEGQTPGWELESGADIAAALVKRYDDSIQRDYHLRNISKQFAATIDEREYSKYFTPQRLPEFIDNKISNLSASAEAWLMDQVIAEITRMYNAGDIKTVYPDGFLESQGTDSYSFLDTVEHQEQLAKKMLAALKGMHTLSALYNKDEVRTRSNTEDLYVIMDVDTEASMTVDVLASAYNLKLLDIYKNLINLPAGTEIQSTVKVDNDGGNTFDSKPKVIIFDYRTLIIGVRTYIMRTFPVANTVWTNHFLSVEGIAGHDTFINAYAFADAESEEGG